MLYENLKISKVFISTSQIKGRFGHCYKNFIRTNATKKKWRILLYGIAKLRAFLLVLKIDGPTKILVHYTHLYFKWPQPETCSMLNNKPLKKLPQFLFSCNATENLYHWTLLLSVKSNISNSFKYINRSKGFCENLMAKHHMKIVLYISDLHREIIHLWNSNYYSWTIIYRPHCTLDQGSS